MMNRLATAAQSLYTGIDASAILGLPESLHQTEYSEAPSQLQSVLLFLYFLDTRQGMSIRLTMMGNRPLARVLPSTSLSG